MDVNGNVLVVTDGRRTSAPASSREWFSERDAPERRIALLRDFSQAVHLFDLWPWSARPASGWTPARLDGRIYVKTQWLATATPIVFANRRLRAQIRRRTG